MQCGASRSYDADMTRFRTGERPLWVKGVSPWWGLTGSVMGPKAAYKKQTYKL